MKRIVLTICVLGFGFLGLSAQEQQDEVPRLVGWSYYGGDEFNGTAIDRKLWGIYGDPTKNYSFEDYGNNEGQGMAQFYRDKMVTVKDGLASVRATREPIYTGLRYKKDRDNSPKMRTPLQPNHSHSSQGWWSGALSSRDADNGGTFYPLYSRIEVKAKIPFCIGTWMALWLRHCNGSSTFEIDLEEFFVHDDSKDVYLDYEKHTYKRAGKNFVHQSVHGLDYNVELKYDEEKGKYFPKNSYNHNDYADRIREIKFDPSKDFHVYGAQIDPEPGDSARNLAVTFLLDGRVRSVFLTSAYKSNKPQYPYRYNALLKDEYFKYGIDRVWDVAITGQVGGKPDGKGGGVLYPENDPQYGGDMNRVPKNYVMDLDWLRVYKRTNRLLWIGSEPRGTDWRTSAVSIGIPNRELGSLQVGDRLIMDIDTLSSSEYRQAGPLSVDIYDPSGKSITTLKPEITRNDAQATFIVTDNNMLNALKAGGCRVRGNNIRIFTIVKETKNDGLWSGFKEIGKEKVTLPALLFNDVSEGQQLQITVRDVTSDGKATLSLWDKAENSLLLSAIRDEKQYLIDINAQTAQLLRTNGLQITGTGFYLRNVCLVSKKKLPTAIKPVNTETGETGAVYTVNGVKVREAKGAGKLSPGIYIIDGKKVSIK